ncbi:MAG: DUF262 domain-containing protein [Deltaproteobacteria bacterium]|nr:DUF262 domain-containing protein [Deltaproteobacteria bacterium]
MMTEQATFKIESNDLSIATIFKDFFSVPDFQREYVWEREHVEKLLQDVLDEFYDEEGRLVEGPEYFLGSIVVCKDNNSIFQLIDGQQRMTTIYLILCAARDALIQTGDRPTRVLQAQISDVYPDPKTGEDIERHRLTLQYEDSDGILEKIVKAEQPVSSLPETTESVRKILSAYGTIREFYAVNLKDNPAEIKRFLVAFTTRIKLIRIVTPTIANALKVFETINDRGVGLNAMDLLKNLLFMKTSSQDYPKLKDRWKTLVDTLDSSGEKPLRFLRYYIMAHHKIDFRRGIREDEIYEWFVNHSNICGIDDDPLAFVDRLVECARAYANFLASKDSQGQPNRYLKNLALLGGALRQQFILLLAGRHLQRDLFDKLCSAIENLFFCYIITREPTKTFERNFARWSGELRGVEDEAGLNSFLEKYFLSDMKGRRSQFEFAFRELTQWGIQQYRMRYILAKLTQYIEEKAWGNPTYAQLEHYTAKTVEVEHILPQNPSPEVRTEFDKLEAYEDYVGKLGNLTLLEKTINSSISNGRYSDKLPGYRQSSFLLTKSLAEKPQVGANTQLNRAVAELIQFQNWNSKAIEQRQDMLASLAFKVWDMPPDSKETTE